MGFSKNGREWQLGEKAQSAWAELMAKCGGISVPLYGAEGNSTDSKAPMLYCCDGLLVAPDILILRQELMRWHEVKAKSIPTWRIKKPGPRWEHGIDRALIDEYRRVQQLSGIKVAIIVHEERSPIGEPHVPELSENSNSLSDFDPAAMRRRIEEAARECLNGSAAWLSIMLDDAAKVGDDRPWWPERNGNRSDHGRDGRGGWLWARSAMRDCTKAVCELIKTN